MANQNFRVKNGLEVGVGGTILYAKDTGRIGIGRTDPGTDLDVAGNIRLSAGDPQIQLNDGGPRLRSPISNTLTIHTGGNLGTDDYERLRITSSGDIGIGTNNPGSGNILSVHGRTILGQVATGDATTKAEMISQASLRIKPHVTSSGALNFAQINNGDGIGLQFTNSTGTANWDIALQPYGGQVGIATDNPTQNLDINGATRFRGAIYDNNNSVGAANSVLSSTGSGVQWVSVSAGSDAGTLDGIDSTQFLRSDADDSASGVIDFLGGSSTTPAVRIKSGGNSWSEGLAIHPSSNNGYALTFYRTTASLTTNTNTWAIGNLGANSTNNFGLLRKDLTGGSGIRVDSIFDVTQSGTFRFGFTPTVGSNTIWHAGNHGSGSGLDADTLDGIQGGSFLRSDADDSTSGQITITKANNATTGGGQIYLNGTTGNRIDFNQNGVDVPTVTTRSSGTKLVLYPALTGTQVDYALGIHGNTLWYSVPTTSQNHRWYGGTTEMMKLYNSTLTVGGNTAWTAGNDGSGSGLDADTLDGINSGSFLRSDAADTASGEILFSSARTDFGSSGGWDGVGFSNLTNIHVRDHNQCWFGAGNGTWFTGTANTKSQASGLAADASYAHDLLISTLQSDVNHDRGITFAVDNTGAGNSGWRLGKWHSGDARDASKFVVDGQIFAKAGYTDEYDYYADDYSAYYSSQGGNAHWAGDSGYGWHVPGIVSSSAIQIQSGNNGTNSRKPQIQFHQYGYGGPAIEYDGPNDTLNIIGPTSRLSNTGFKQQGNTIWHAGNDGSGSGLDADTLDGINSGSFLRSDSADTSSAMLVCYTSLTNNDDYFNSPISIRERGAAAAGDGEDRDSPNLNFHWSGRVSKSFWMGANGYMNWGEYNSSGVPQVDGTFRAGNLLISSSSHQVWHAGNDGSGSGLDADSVDGIDSSRIIYGSNANGTNQSDPSTALKSGFYDTYQTNAPTATWYSYINIRHNSTSSNYGHQIAGSFFSTGDLYNRNINNGSYGSWTKIWNASNDGSGSGLDADTLDGINSGSFLRSDASDTWSGTLSWGASDTHGLSFQNSSYTGNYLYIGGWDGGTNSSGISRIRNSNANLHLDSGSNGGLYLNHYSAGTVYARGSVVWHAGNDGSGSGLDADLLDGFQYTTFMRRDQTYSSDLNTVALAGVYRVNSFTNGPSGGASYGTLLNANNASDTGAQFYINYNDGNVFTRGGNSSTFNGSGSNTAWAKQWSSENDGSGSGLDADLLDGLSWDTYGKNLRGIEIYADNWFRNYNSGEGLYNEATTQHFYSDSDDGWNVAGGTSANWIRFRDEYNGTIRGYVYADNGSQVGFLNSGGGWSLRMDNSGNCNVTGTVTANSDIKLKTNITTITNALDKVRKLRGVEFDYIDTGKHMVGVIAQEVEEVIPEVVMTTKDKDSDDETKSVAYANMVAVLIEAIKEQQNKIDEYGQMIREQQNKIDELEQIIKDK